ncbi:Auxin-induced in root cultures protein 12 [Zea mays]|uniref:Auxin-induced in root cultures protein 12 n=1 Tax=Zea mays TaxID=4577 RepID=A0A317YI12_MAIZE|nr:Auxin-induced in root cultures protein 12 [Zea mays]
MASATVHQLVVLLLTLALPAVMSACASEVFPAGKTYVTCQDLPELGAALHWTYYDYASGPSLSLAFVAVPAAPGGWVAWGINPTGNGMVGTQALLALVPGASSSVPTVRTYNITSYAVGAASTPITFPTAGLAADVASGGRIRLYATLQLDKGIKVVNQVWQVGPSVTRGVPDTHAMAPENLAAMGKLVLSVGTAASPPAHAGGTSSDTTPSGRQMSRGAETDSVSLSPTARVVLALLGFWAMVG